MNALVWLALALAVLWFLGVAVFEVVGFAIHLALIAAALLLIAWGVRKVMGGRGKVTV